MKNLLFIFLQVIFCLALPSQPDSAASVNRARIDSLLARIEKVRQLNNIPGLGISLVKNNKEIYKGGLGLSSCEKKTSCTASTVFRVGSISKTFVGLGILKLVQEGKLKLSDKLSIIAPEIHFTNPWEETDPVRIVHLLEHTTGFDDMRTNEWTSETLNTPIADAVQKNNGSKTSRWTPGTFYSYSNVNFSIAGYILEKISGQKFDDYLAKEILAPIGMSNSTFKMSDALKDQLARGYDPDCESTVSFHDVFLRPAGSLNSTAEDLGKLTLWMLLKGKLPGQAPLLDSASFSKLFKTESTLLSKRGLAEQYGKGVYVTHHKGFGLWGHVGVVDGYRSEYAFSDMYDFGFVLLVNSSNIEGIKEIRDIILEFLTHDLPRSSWKPHALSEAMRERYSGTYLPVMIRNEVMICGRFFETEELCFLGDTLCFAGKKLIPVSDSLFMEPDAYGSTHALTSFDGNLLFINGNKSGYQQVSPAFILMVKGLVIMAATIVLLYFLYSASWLLLKILRRERMSQFNTAKKLSMFSVIMPFVLMFLLQYGLNNRDIYSRSILAVSIVYIILTCMGLILHMFSRVSSENRFWKTVPLLVYFANVILLIWLYPTITTLI